MPGSSALAPLIAAWQARNRGLPAPRSAAAGLPILGVPILSSVFASARLCVEFAFGAVLSNPEASWIWYDVTADVSQANGNRITISVGGQDEEIETSPAGCQFILNNPDGQYTAFNAYGPYWPNVKRNTPVRVRVSLDGGLTWTVRYEGYVNGFTPSWDQSLRAATVSVDASGILRRVQQGRTPLHSALFRAIAASAPAAYWPLEDGTSATKGASALVGGTPMLAGNSPIFITNTKGSPPSFGTADAPAGSASLADFSQGGILVGQVPLSTATSWRVELSANVSALEAADFVSMFQIVMTSGTLFDFTTDAQIDASSGIFAQYFAADGTFADNFPASNTYVDNGIWQKIRVEATKNGSNTTLVLTVNSTQLLSWNVPQAFAPISYIVLNPGQDTAGSMKFGHVVAWTPWPGGATVDPYIAFDGRSGETPRTRLTRLCLEEGIALDVVNFYFSDKTMGPQGVDTLANLLRECELTDSGFLYDGFSAGLKYQGISQRFDQAVGLTLNVLNRDLPDLVPVDDDQRNRNLIIVSQRDGSSATAEDDTGQLGTESIGTYDSTVQINSEDVDVLPGRASWEVHAGTVAGFRYPSLSLQLTDKPGLASRWLARTDGSSGPVIPGCRIDVTNVSTLIAQHPIGTVSLVLEGYTEEISGTQWNVKANCSPNSIYDVYKVADSRLGRFAPGVGDCTLAADAPAGSTSLSIATVATSPLWSTAVGDYPQDFEIDGIQVTVTAVAGSSSPQTFTANATSRILATGDIVNLWQGGVVKL